MGHDATVAGLFWIKGLTELGESYLTGKEYAYLGHVAELSTSLDTLFYTPYYFVGGVTPIDAPDTSDFSVLRRATRVYPENWRLALYYALRVGRGPYPNKTEAANVIVLSKGTANFDYPSVVLQDFEKDTANWYFSVDSAGSKITYRGFETDKSRKSKVFHGKYSLFASNSYYAWVLSGMLLRGEGWNFSSLDSISFDAKGSGQIRISLENWDRMSEEAGLSLVEAFGRGAFRC